MPLRLSARLFGCRMHCHLTPFPLWRCWWSMISHVIGLDTVGPNGKLGARNVVTMGDQEIRKVNAYRDTPLSNQVRLVSRRYSNQVQAVFVNNKTQSRSGAQITHHRQTMSEPNKPAPPPPPNSPNATTSTNYFGQKVSYPNPPDPVNPDAATLKEQWRFAIRQYSKWYSHAWGTAILAGVAFFALGWVVKGGNPIPSFNKHEDDKDRKGDENDSGSA